MHLLSPGNSELFSQLRLAPSPADTADLEDGLWPCRACAPASKPVIDAVLAGRHTLAIMPTGAGKSLCYQIPAVLMPGITVVVSPLIALMQDQFEKMSRGALVRRTFAL